MAGDLSNVLQDGAEIREIDWAEDITGGDTGAGADANEDSCSTRDFRGWGGSGDSEWSSLLIFGIGMIRGEAMSTLTRVNCAPSKIATSFPPTASWAKMSYVSCSSRPALHSSGPGPGPGSGSEESASTFQAAGVPTWVSDDAPPRQTPGPY